MEAIYTTRRVTRQRINDAKSDMEKNLQVNKCMIYISRHATINYNKKNKMLLFKRPCAYAEIRLH
jgi:hypothetical protein